VTRWPGAAVRLTGRRVSLEPLAADHAEGLFLAAQDPRIWDWMPGDPSGSPTAFGAWFGQAAEALRHGEEVPFAVRDLDDGGRLVGSTRYLALVPEHRRLEIGWTWYSPPVWRTGVNIECKLLLLGHAFEHLHCRRVELKTDARNERSRAAILALGAQFEGIHRKHMVVPGDGVRDTAWYSVIDDEWPVVRDRLRSRLGATAPSRAARTSPGPDEAA
jgi:RimJ/RimL family protein N-acetyltransferase